MNRSAFAPLAASLLFGAPAFAQSSDRAPVPPPPIVAPSPADPLPHLNAGYGQDSFYLRSDDDNFILIPSGRFQFDFLGYQGAGLPKSGTGVGQAYDTFFPRRARLETFGTLYKHFDFQLGAEFTGGTAPVTSDIFVNVNYTHLANVQLGQFDAPFTMENRTSDKYTDLQERTTSVRGFAIPETKHVGGMVWGQPAGKWAYWSLGLFNGEGQNQFKHTSNHFDGMGRAWIAPFGIAPIALLKDVWVGGSFHSGDRAWSAANQLDRAAFSDQARFTFFNTAYTGPTGSTAGATAPAANNLHVGDDGALLKYALELNAPVGPFVLKGEYIHLHEGTRELDLQAKSATYVPAAPKSGALNGAAYYVRLSWFAFGDPLINGLAGTQNPPHLFGALKPNKTGDALQFVVQWEHMGWNYAATETVASDKLAGDGGLSILTVGANYWATKRVRLTYNFLYNMPTGTALHPLAEPNSFQMTGRIALAL